MICHPLPAMSRHRRPQHRFQGHAVQGIIGVRAKFSHLKVNLIFNDSRVEKSPGKQRNLKMKGFFIHHVLKGYNTI